MMLIGHEGYVEATRRIIETTRHIEAKSVVLYKYSIITVYLTPVVADDYCFWSCSSETFFGIAWK